MQATMCPFCLKMVQTEICPYCGSNVDYPGYPSHLPVGYTLQGRNVYILGAAKGQGGFGITYIALDMETNQRVAIKEYYPNHCCGRSNSTYVHASYGQEETFSKGRAHFLQEAQMLQSLSDLPSVVKVLDYFEANNSAYLVMEYLDGLSLKDHVEQNGKMPAQPFLNQLKPLMADMEKMHQRGVVHRDIAPDNIILLPDGRLKLIDFGAARSYVGDKSMTVVVKKGFAPIEQYMRKGSNASTDVYALAATIYYCITGIVPPDSAERQYGEAIMTAPSALGVELRPGQEYALEKALELQPKDRIQTIEGLEEQLFSVEPAACEQKPTGEETDRKAQKAHPAKEKKPAPKKAEKTEAEEHKRREEAEARKEKQKALLAKTAKGAAVAAAAAVVLYAGSWGMKYFQYTSAEKAVQEGNYDKAYSTFVSLKDFRDSRQKALETRYSQGDALQKEEKFTEAALAFDEAAGYRDGAERAAYCRKEADYTAAEKLFEAQQYREAAEAFNALGEHSDSTERARESGYLYGMVLLENGEYGQAYEVFGMLSTYKDSSDYADQAGYLYADALNGEKKYHEAYTVYSQISDYKDSLSLGQQAEYQYALECVEQKQYPEGIAAFERLENYRDSVKKVQETRFIYAGELVSASQWKQASELYAELKDYQDSKKRYLDTRYRYAYQLMEAQAYTDAVREYEQLGDYVNSAEYLLEAKYLYASSHPDRMDAVTAQYLDDLRLLSYKDASALYQSLFGWKVTLTAVNTEPEDGETKLNEVPVNTDYLHFRFVLEGGKPSETVDLTYRIVWPGGAQKNGKSVWQDAASGYYLDCSWSNGLYENLEKGKTGTMKVQVYNKATGEFLGEGAVSLTK